MEGLIGHNRVAGSRLSGSREIRDQAAWPIHRKSAPTSGSVAQRRSAVDNRCGCASGSGDAAGCQPAPSRATGSLVTDQHVLSDQG